MSKPHKSRRLVDAYRFPGFCPLPTLQGIFGDPQARLITLVRRGKKQSAAAAGRFTSAGTTVAVVAPGICRVAGTASISIWRCGAFSAAAAAR
jgi:hypothetical protein